MHGELRKAGVCVATHHVARFMQKDQLVAPPRRCFVRTTDSNYTDAIALRLLNRNLSGQAQVARDRVWVSDVVPRGHQISNSSPKTWSTPWRVAELTDPSRLVSRS